ncbi:hypothetical protein OG21DRAFT_1397128, partial [Imleria badia]
VETLPAGPKWLSEQMQPEDHTKQLVCLFYCPPLECIQSILSNLILAPHISLFPGRFGHRLRESGEIPDGGTLLGVVLSSDKTNISVISGNRMAYPLLISLENINPEIHSKTLLHPYLLLALLPI